MSKAKKHLEPVHDEAAHDAPPAVIETDAPAEDGPKPVRIITHEIINLGDALRGVHKFLPNDSPLDRTEACVIVRDDGTVQVDVLATVD